MKFKVFTLALFCSIALSAQTKEEFKPDFSVPYVSYADSSLYLDIYLPQDTLKEHYCIIHSYGGGFIENNQRAPLTKKYCRKLAEEGYVVIASDYRLGLKGVKMKGKLSMVKSMKKAVKMAAEDIFKVTSFALEHADEWKVRPDGIILCGSSAGAITSLQCDYELCNRTEISTVLPEDFHYAGIISFAGAVFSEEGKCDYRKHDPAPTMFLHGKADVLVKYNKISFFRKRLSGSNDLVKRFAKNGWSYEIIRFEDEGHGVAIRMLDNFSDVIWFLNNMVKTKQHYEIDKTVYDRGHTRSSWDKMGPGALF